MLIHAEKVARKYGSFIAAGAASDFHQGVLAVVGIGRNQQELYILLHIRKFLFK